MACKYGQKKIISYLCCSICIMAFISCSAPVANNTLQIVNTDSICSGDIICRLGNGYFSNLFRLNAGDAKRFSHIGLIQKQNDSIYVYHTEASELNGVGGVCKHTLDVFLEEAEDYAVYRYASDTTVTHKIVAQALYYFNANVPFDLAFDLSSDSTLYCSEYIANCINLTTAENQITPSTKGGYKLYLLDDILDKCRLIIDYKDTKQKKDV